MEVWNVRRSWTPAALRRPSIRRALVLLVLATLVPLLAFVAIVLAINTRLQEGAAEERLIDTARVLALAIDQDLRTAQAALEVLARSPLVDRGDWRGFHERAAEVGQLHGGWVVLGDRDNQQLVNTTRPYGSTLPRSAAADVVQSVFRTGRPVVTDLVLGAVQQRPLIGIAVPVLRGGEVRFFLGMGLLPERIVRLLEASESEPTRSVAVFDRQARVVARVPGGADVGQTAVPELAAAMQREPQGWRRATTFEHAPAYFAFARVPLAGWTVAVGIPEAVAYADSNRALYLVVAGGIVALVLGPLLAMMLGRRIAAPLGRLAVAARARDPDAVPRDPGTAVAEVAGVYEALREAIESRQREDREHQQRVAEETRRLVAERTLSSVVASEERWRTLFEQAGEPIVIADLRAVCREANPAACHLLGYERAHLVGMSFARLVSPEDVARLADLLAALVEGEIHTGEWTLICRDGRPVPVELNARLLFDGRWQAFLRDVTERRRAEEQRARFLALAESARAEAESASQMKDEFLATVSHELRTPLSAVLGWLRLLRSGSLDPERAAHALDVIERNVRAQSVLIRDLLDVSRIIRGTLALDLASDDLSRVTADACEALRPVAEAKRIVLECAIQPQIRGVFDASRMQQVVWNLVTNALKFTPPAGRVEVGLEAVDGERATLTVRDTGPGITAERLPRLFERFQRFDVGGSPEVGGLGIGLAVVKHLVEQHGGTVKAGSGGSGTGAIFTVTLPLTGSPASPPGRPPAGAPADASLAGRRVLLVDDDADTREIVQSLLAEQGAEAELASGVREALAKLSARRYDVVVSDIAMPDGDGYSLLAGLQGGAAAASAGIPVIALTAHASEHDRRRALGAGFHRHLAKPIDPDALVAAIAELARGALAE